MPNMFELQFFYWLNLTIQVIFQGEISKYKYLIFIIFQVPVRRPPSPGTGTRPGGWETLL